MGTLDRSEEDQLIELAEFIFRNYTFIHKYKGLVRIGLSGLATNGGLSVSIDGSRMEIAAGQKQYNVPHDAKRLRNAIMVGKLRCERRYDKGEHIELLAEANKIIKGYQYAGFDN